MPFLGKVVLLCLLGALVALCVPFRWWQVRPGLQPDTLIGSWLAPYLDVSLRNLFLRTLFLLFVGTLAVYTVVVFMALWMPIFALFFLVWHLLARLFSRTYEPDIHAPGIVVITVLLWLASVGLLAPLKLSFLGLYLARGRPAGGVLEDLTVAPGNEWTNAVLGIAGATVVFVWLARDAIWRSRQAKEVASLPTSKARSVALGLVELKGAAQPVSSDAGPILRLHWDMFSYLEPSQQLKPFYLVDVTGRVLVDPTGCEIRAGWIADLKGPFGRHEIFLTRRVERDDRFDSVTRTLMPGDPVYVVGTAEINPEAPRDAVDSERLVVRASSASHWSASLWRFLFAGATPPSAQSIFNVFFISDGGEMRARREVARGLRTVRRVGCVWLVSSAALVWLAIAPLAPPPDAWRTAYWVAAPPRYGFIDERYARFEKYLKTLGPQSFQAIPALIEALNYKDLRYRRDAASKLGSMLPAAREQARDAVPALRETLRMSRRNETIQSTIRTLGHFGPLAEPAVPDLVELLQDRDNIVRFVAASALGDVGPSARAAIPALTEALRDRSPAVRDAARRALKQIQRGQVSQSNIGLRRSSLAAVAPSGKCRISRPDPDPNRC